MKNKNICPLCLTSKKYYTGRKYVDCTLCDDEGFVDDETDALYNGGEEDII